MIDLKVKTALKSLTLGLSLLGLSHLHAAVITTTLPANNQANLTADAGQTFTTGSLYNERILDTIEIANPATGSGSLLGPFILELWTDTDGNYATWDPNTLVASSINTGTFTAGSSTPLSFQFPATRLSDGAVYAFTYTDPSNPGTRLSARVGLTNASTIPNGTVFSAGNEVFGGAFDTAFRVNAYSVSVPEPSTLTFLIVGLCFVKGARRKIFR